MSAAKIQNPQSPVAFLLSQIGARSAQVFAGLLAPLQLTPPDVGILGMLSRSPGISQQELARRLNIYSSRLVAVIDALEERSLVSREPNAADRRIYCLHLSDAGKEALRAIGQLSQAHNEAMCAGLNHAERAQLSALLQKIADHQQLVPGIHPGYRNMGPEEGGPCDPTPRTKR